MATGINKLNGRCVGLAMVGLLAGLPVSVVSEPMMAAGSGRGVLSGEYCSVMLAEHIVEAARQFCGERSAAVVEWCGVEVVDVDEVLVGVDVVGIWLGEWEYDGELVLMNLPPPHC